MNTKYPERYELPICDNPIVTTNFIGLLYSVFEAYEKDLTPILINHHINVSSELDTRYDYSLIFNDHWLEKEKVMHRHHITWHESVFKNDREKLIKPLLGFIVNGYYICGNFNAFYISEKKAYKCYDTNTAYLLYGYDLEEKSFLAVGNTKRGVFEKYKISFEEYADSVLERTSGYLNWNIVKFNENFEIKPDLKRVYNGILDYINGKNESFGRKALPHQCYGIDCYRKLLRRLSLLDDFRNSLDAIGYQNLLDHHVLMQRRIEYLLKSNIITDKSLASEYKKICELSSRIYENHIKYNQSGEAYLIRDIRADAEEILDREPNILNRVLEEIKIYFAVK